MAAVVPRLLSTFAKKRRTKHKRKSTSICMINPECAAPRTAVVLTGAGGTAVIVDQVEHRFGVSQKISLVQSR